MRCYAAVVEMAAAGQHIGILSDRRLGVAALAALLQPNGDVRPSGRAEGPEATHQLLLKAGVGLVVADFGGVPGPDLGWVLTGAPLIVVVAPAPGSTPAALRNLRPRGYVSSAAPRDTLLDAIDVVLSGGSFADQGLPDRSSLGDMPRGPQPGASLSPAEYRVLYRIARGRSSKQIAKEFDLSNKTVCNHVSGIYRKLGMENRGQLVLYATRTRL